MKLNLAANVMARQRESATFRAYLVLFASVGAFGFSAIFANWAQASGLVVAMWRLGVAALLLTIPFLRQPAAQRQLDRATLRKGLTGGAVFAFAIVNFHIALDHGDAAGVVFLGNIAPIWVGLITLLVLRERLPRLFWPGVAAALGGAALIVFGDGGGLAGIQLGHVLVLAGSVVWAAYIVYTGQVRAPADGRPGLSALTWVWLVLVVSSVLVLPLLPLAGEALFGYPLETMLAMIGAGVFSQGLGFIGFNFALGALPAARVSVINLLQPVVTAIAAAILLAQPFVGWRLVGGALILFGVYLVIQPEREE